MDENRNEVHVLNNYDLNTTLNKIIIWFQEEVLNIVYEEQTNIDNNYKLKITNIDPGVLNF